MAVPFFFSDQRIETIAYRNAKAVLDAQLGAPFPNTLDEVRDFTSKAIQILFSDVDFCDQPYESSILALTWACDTLYQENVNLEPKDFWSLCGDLVVYSEEKNKQRHLEWWKK